MARLPRLSISGYPHHVLQRGNNRQVIFTSPADYQKMLSLMLENAQKFKVEIHAYVLMTNHFHLLVTPQDNHGLSQMMQAIGRSYVRWFNDSKSRTGTLWEGRFKSTVIDTDQYLLTCMAYLDLNPVRAGVVVKAADYAWSSHGHYIGQKVDKLITPHPLVWGLGNTPFAREAAYADLVQGGISASQTVQLTDAALRGWALGDPDFVADLQTLTQRRVSKAAAGRPLKATETLK